MGRNLNRRAFASCVWDIPHAGRHSIAIAVEGTDAAAKESADLLLQGLTGLRRSMVMGGHNDQRPLRIRQADGAIERFGAYDLCQSGTSITPFIQMATKSGDTITTDDMTALHQEVRL
jgi:hypothetical protein